MLFRLFVLVVLGLLCSINKVALNSTSEVSNGGEYWWDFARIHLLAQPLISLSTITSIYTLVMLSTTDFWDIWFGLSFIEISLTSLENTMSLLCSSSFSTTLSFFIYFGQQFSHVF